MGGRWIEVAEGEGWRWGLGRSNRSGSRLDLGGGDRRWGSFWLVWGDVGFGRGWRGVLGRVVDGDMVGIRGFERRG
jgi:hypothetical protein